MSAPAIVLAYDEGAGVGLGHRRRCEALAAALEQRALSPRIEALGPELVRGDVVIVDSYATRADDRSRIRASAVVALDDLDRDLDVECVVDPSPGADRSVHRRARHVLAGADYALVAPTLASVVPTPLGAAVRRVLITTGAADAEGVGAYVAAALVAARRDLRVRLALGPWGSRVVPRGVEALDAGTGLADELGSADVVVCAGGVTLLESLALGRPSVAIELAENQRRNVDSVVAAGAAARATPMDAGAVVAALCDDPERRLDLARSGARLIDGQGATRVATAVAQLCSVTLRDVAS